MVRTCMLVCLSLIAPAIPWGQLPAQDPSGGDGSSGFRPGFGLVLETTLELGGDKIVTATFTDGSKESLNAGDGVTFAAGLEYRPAALPQLMLVGSLGYKLGSVSAENATLSLTRIPLELSARYAFTKGWWGGVGLVQHTGISFDGDGFVSDFDLDDAKGFTIEVGYRWIGLTYTAMDYKDDLGPVGAGSVGMSFQYVIGRKQ